MPPLRSSLPTPPLHRPFLACSPAPAIFPSIVSPLPSSIAPTVLPSITASIPCLPTHYPAPPLPSCIAPHSLSPTPALHQSPLLFFCAPALPPSTEVSFADLLFVDLNFAPFFCFWQGGRPVRTLYPNWVRRLLAVWRGGGGGWGGGGWFEGVPGGVPGGRGFPGV